MSTHDDEQTHVLITLGTGSGYAARGRGGPAHLVRVKQHDLLLDCGEGVSGWIVDLGLAAILPVICISHLHPDHVSGLFVLLQNMKLQGRNQDLTIYLPEAGIEPLQSMLRGLYLDFTPANAPFHIFYKPIGAGELFRTPDYILTAWESDHFDKDIQLGRTPRPAFGFTIDTAYGRLVYTGDVASESPFAAQLNPQTTLVCESTHVDPRNVLNSAEKAGVKRVVFVHIDPQKLENLEKICNQNNLAYLAYDGLKIYW